MFNGSVSRQFRSSVSAAPSAVRAAVCRISAPSGWNTARYTSSAASAGVPSLVNSPPTAENTACTSTLRVMASDSFWLMPAILPGSSSFAATSSTKMPPQVTRRMSRKRSAADRASVFPD